MAFIYLIFLNVKYIFYYSIADAGSFNITWLPLHMLMMCQEFVFQIS